MALLVCYSKTGNTLTMLPFIKQHVEVDEDFILSSSIKDYDHIFIGTYTWGDGKIPKKLKQYLIENKDYFKGKKVFVFGSGNSVYPKFCGAVDGIVKIVTDCGADLIGTFKFEQLFRHEECTKEEVDNLIRDLKSMSH